MIASLVRALPASGAGWASAGSPGYPTAPRTRRQPDAHAVARSARLLVTRRGLSTISRPRTRIRTRRVLVLLLVGPFHRDRSRRSPARRWSLRGAPTCRWTVTVRRSTRTIGGRAPGRGLARRGAGESEGDGQGADAHREDEPGRDQTVDRYFIGVPFVSVSGSLRTGLRSLGKDRRWGSPSLPDRGR